jgi:hypothetical protein
MSTTLVTPLSSHALSVYELKSPENWRAFFHDLTAVVVPVLVTAHIATEAQVLAWVPFVFALVDNLLSAGNTSDKLRRTVYGAAAALQTGGLVTTLLVDSPELVPIAGAGLSMVTAIMARFFTGTTTLVPKAAAAAVADATLDVRADTLDERRAVQQAADDIEAAKAKHRKLP